MDKKNCVINPKTGRAVKADSKIGKMILGIKAQPKKAEPKKAEPKKVEAKKNVPHTMYKDAKAVHPNRADFEKKKELEKAKEPYTKYKNPIGVKIKDVPPILVKGKHKNFEPDYKNVYTYRTDGMTMGRIIDYEKSKWVDNPFWRNKLPTPNEIEKGNDIYIKEKLKDFLGLIDIYLKLNTKLENDDIANFRALSPTIDLLIKQKDLRKIIFDDFLEKSAVKDLNKYLKLKKKIEKLK